MFAAGVVELLPDDLQDNLSGAGAVQLNQEDALPATQLELSIDNGDGLAGTHEQVLAVGVAVGALVFVHVHRADGEVVVAVLGASRLKVLEELAKVLEQKGFVLLDRNCGRRVLREHEAESVEDAGLPNVAGDRVRNVDKLWFSSGLHGHREDASTD